jgi:hypothetical protein
MYYVERLRNDSIKIHTSKPITENKVFEYKKLPDTTFGLMCTKDGKLYSKNFVQFDTTKNSQEPSITWEELANAIKEGVDKV